MGHRIVDSGQWRRERIDFLNREKEFQETRDRLAEARRNLPWEKVDREYRFQAGNGELSLAELFGACSQLIVYHFMYHPDWDEGCKSCSFWADGFDRMVPHLRQRDVAMVAISRAPIEKLHAYRKRMGWSFPWVSSGRGGFSEDFEVSFSPEQLASGNVRYNYRERGFSGEEAPGISVFIKEGGNICHTYSTYARGLDPFNPAYQYLDIVPRGRDEDKLSYPMEWVKRRDEY